MTVLGWIICAVIAVNFILFVLRLFPAFSGFGEQPELADRLLGNYRLGLESSTVVWVFRINCSHFDFGACLYTVDIG